MNNQMIKIFNLFFTQNFILMTGTMDQRKKKLEEEKKPNTIKLKMKKFMNKNNLCN